MLKRLSTVAIIMLMVLALPCCGSPAQAPSGPADSPPASGQGQAEGEYRKITTPEAQAMIAEGALVLDVRTKEEYDGGHIRDAVLLPVDEIKEKADSVLTDKNQTIIVYCRSGARSKNATEQLIGMGYAEVYDLGGIIDWTGEIVVEAVITGEADPAQS